MNKTQNNPIIQWFENAKRDIQNFIEDFQLSFKRALENFRIRWENDIFGVTISVIINGTKVILFVIDSISGAVKQYKSLKDPNC